MQYRARGHGGVEREAIAGCEEGVGRVHGECGDADCDEVFTRALTLVCPAAARVGGDDVFLVRTFLRKENWDGVLYIKILKPYVILCLTDESKCLFPSPAPLIMSRV